MSESVRVGLGSKPYKTVIKKIKTEEEEVRKRKDREGVEPGAL